MFSKEKGDTAFPAVPPSLHDSSFEMDEVKRAAQTTTTTAPPDTAGGITPYLGLRARLSQIWLNRWTVLLILVLVRVMISLSSLNDDLDDAKAKALSACTKVEDIGSAMASMPHYLSVGVNDLAAEGISKAVNGMVDILMMILTGVEELILFVINMYVGTYACLIAAFIHGGLDVGISAVDGATKAMNEGITTITGEITDDISKVQDTINDAFDSLTNVANAFGGDVSAPVINITGRLNDLKNIKIDDTDFVGDLVTLNKTIPTFAQVQNLTRQAVSIPFDLVKQMLNNSYAGYSFDKSIFPVAEKEALTFCSDNSVINDFFTNLYEIAAKAKIAFIVVLVVLAVLACVAMSWFEIKRYRRQQRHAQILTQHGYDPMDVVYIASRPVTATAGIKIASRFSGKRQLLVRWCIAYGTSLPALFVLSLALAGFFSCFCQWIVLRAIQNEAPALASQVGDFAEEVVTTLQSVSQRWANGANSVVTNFNDEINDDVLGYVTNATTAVNDTLNTFDAEMSKALDDVFNGTVLEQPVRDVVACLIGNKIDAVQEGLTWVHDNAHVSFPLFPNDTFSVGANESITSDKELTSFLASPSSVTTDEITGAVDHVVEAMRHGIVQEALISTGLLLVYVIVVLIGVVRALAGMAGRDRTRGEGGQRFYYTGDGRAPLTPRHSPTASSSAAAARFPDFGITAPETALEDDYRVRAERDGKIAHAMAVPVSTGLRSPGHWRKSSHGYVEGEDR
ncbi:Plasma membrane fusion protein PRM1 [Pleurostoma richardsiae]|uniref:Plasma membrane fusion protein PRM1 n=1 Tax=Pleurostoma richardsiae TaxID=41990 RepID=A0AA38VE25_9PEZI|nr:Plasma membrane fusion protein PRM1 [Pleurostoma richardsiae]